MHEKNMFGPYIDKRDDVESMLTKTNKYHVAYWFLSICPFDVIVDTDAGVIYNINYINLYLVYQLRTTHLSVSF